MRQRSVSSPAVSLDLRMGHAGSGFGFEGLVLACFFRVLGGRGVSLHGKETTSRDAAIQG